MDKTETESRMKVYTVHQKQKNGSIYVLERRQYWDPKLNKNVYGGQKLIGKILPGQSEMIKTRDKAPSKLKTEGERALAKAAKERIGLMKLLDRLGQISGLDEKIQASLPDPRMAEILISLARFLLATNGAKFKEIEAWQLIHPTSFQKAITKPVYLKLFEEIGQDPSIKENFFCLLLDDLDHEKKPEKEEKAPAVAQPGIFYLSELQEADRPLAFYLEKEDPSKSEAFHHALYRLNKPPGDEAILALQNKDAACAKAADEAGRKLFQTLENKDTNEAAKDRSAASRHNVLEGEIFVFFVALLYTAYLDRKLEEMKEHLGQKNGKRKHDQKKPLSEEKKLRDWLEERSLHELLMWFDGFEESQAADQILMEPWSEEALERDKLFLEKLGLLQPESA